MAARAPITSTATMTTFLAAHRKFIIRALEAGRAYDVITSGNLAGNVGNFTNTIATIAGPGTVYSFDSLFMLDDAVPDDSDGINDSITFSNLPIGTHTFTEYVPDTWNLSGAVCTGGSDSGTSEQVIPCLLRLAQAKM